MKPRSHYIVRIVNFWELFVELKVLQRLNHVKFTFKRRKKKFSNFRFRKYKNNFEILIGNGYANMPYNNNTLRIRT